jgi:uncharacterized protein (DUF934 family)
MTGPEHYRESERLISEVRNQKAATLNARSDMIALAGVHATLALVAARLPLPRDHRAWAEVLNGESE